MTGAPNLFFLGVDARTALVREGGVIGLGRGFEEKTSLHQCFLEKPPIPRNVDVCPWRYRRSPNTLYKEGSCSAFAVSGRWFGGLDCGNSTGLR